MLVPMVDTEEEKVSTGAHMPMGRQKLVKESQKSQKINSCNTGYEGKRS